MENFEWHNRQVLETNKSPALYLRSPKQRTAAELELHLSLASKASIEH